MKFQNEIVTFEKLQNDYSTYIKDPKDLALIERAYRFAEKKHEGQFRKSGDPYISHCLGVADILAELQVGPQTICAGLLHDTIEDTGTSREEIEQEFGKEIGNLVEALTKVTRLSDYKNVEFTAENHRKIFVAMAKDVRAIIVKLADRLHNMRTLQFQPEEKQRRISKETLEVYAPIAHRLGLYKIQTELEELSLFYSEPEKYRTIEQKVETVYQDARSGLDKLKRELERILAPTHIPFKILDRVKSIYSIYKKMYIKHYTFDQIYDIMALRVITETEQNCYEILGYVHANFKPVPGRFKDYIAMPKANMYQALHTTVFAPNDSFVQVQIKTTFMNYVSTYGLPSYWHYMGDMARYKMQEDLTNKINFYDSVEGINQLFSSNQDFVNQVRKEILSKNIHVFNSKGCVIYLPSGSTIVDYLLTVYKDKAIHVDNVSINGSLSSNYGQVLNDNDIICVVLNEDKVADTTNWEKMTATSLGTRTLSLIKKGN